MHTQKSVEEIIAGIETLDLDPIKFKLMDPEEGQGWSRQYVEEMAVAYKRFLKLLVKHPEAAIAPSKDIDKFWHGHILDTVKYAADCEKVFGYFLHHFPYFGMRGADDAAALADAGDLMQELYEREFGEPMPQSKAAYCMASKPAYCMASAKAIESAYCMASKPSYCMSASPTMSTSYCMAAKPAYCMAAIQAIGSAYCMASASAYCMASRPGGAADLRTRPTLAQAA